MKLAILDDVVYAYALGELSAVGGAERIQWLLARALARNGWVVTVGVRDALGAGECRTVEGVNFVGIGSGQILASWFEFFRRHRPDWWFWRCASHLFGPGVEIARFLGVRTIFSVALDRDVHPRRALFWRPRLWPVYAWGLSRTDKIFVQHIQQFHELSPSWQAEAHILPGIVNQPEQVTPHRDREKYVAWVAVLKKVKRPDLLVKIAEQMPHQRFVVCGEPSTFMSPPGYGEQILKALQACHNIEFLGKASPAKALEIIANACILLSTSDEEGFPSTFLEAWAGGTPVVSLKIDPNETIQRLRLGALSGTVENAITEIERLMNSPQTREEISLRTRRYVANVHSENKVTAIFEGAIRGEASSWQVYENEVRV